MNVLLWLRRDLRATDHPALAVASGLGSVMPVSIVDPNEWQRGDLSARHWGFVSDCLRDLRDEFAQIGLPLVVRRGATQDVLSSLIRAYEITHIVTHRSADHWADDESLRHWAESRAVTWVEVDPSEPIEASTPITPVPEVSEGIIPDARALGFGADDPAPVQAGGRRRGIVLARDCIAKQLRGLHLSDQRPDPSAVIRLQPHFAWGTVGPREVKALIDEMSDTDSRPPSEDIARLLAMIPMGHRSAPMFELSNYPAQTTHFVAWAEGKIGWPFHDAAMRALRSTGNLSDPLVRYLALVGCGHLELPTASVCKHIARQLTHYHPALFTEWFKDGLTAADARRKVPNPLRFGERADPQGVFIRQWLPELAPIPDGFVHRPWDWMQPATQRQYPLPLVELAQPPKRTAGKAFRPVAAQSDLRQGAFDFLPPRVSAIADG